MSYKPEHYNEARKRVNKIKKFHAKVASYLVMSLFFVFLFTFVVRQPWITLFVILPWGAGIAKEGVEIYGFPGMGKNWEKRMMQNELEKLELEELRELRRTNSEQELELKDNAPTEDEYLDLKEFKELRKEWKDTDFV